ncbi:MAG: hypothetical protein GY832_28200 [Chloroflexi bacterium]|nr:hypothetical protein [Chloroflexota bacterium]
MAAVTSSKVEGATKVAEGARIGVGVALSVLSGVLLLLAFQPYGVWPLMWVALVPCLYAQYRLMPLRYSSVAVTIRDLVWLWPMLMRIFAGGPWYLVHMGLIIAVLGLFLNTERKFHELTGHRWLVLHGVVNWVGFEMIRTFIPMMGTMGFAGYTQASQTWLIQPVSIFGVYGMGLLIMLVNYALAQSLFVALDRKWLPADAVAMDARRSRRWLVGVGVGLAAWIGLSLIILGTAPKDAATVRVGLLQPGFPAPAHIDTETPQELRVRTLLEQGREAAQQGADVLFTPELGMAVDPQVEYTDEFKALATETDTHVFWTYGLDVDAGFRNESVLMTPSGQFLKVYGKVHPAPGEPKAIYSDQYPVYETDHGRLATVICMDGVFTDATRRLAKEGAELIAIPTRETVGISEQTWTYHIFRAIETRTAIVHTDVAWYSHIIDPYGRVLLTKDVSESTRQVLVSDVPLGSGNTVVNVLGDWLGWLSLAGFIGFMIFQSRVEKQAKQTAAS